MANANRMQEDMFSSCNYWDCEDHQLLMLRAYAPEDVFTDEAKETFLASVEGREDLEEIADALFSDDEDLVFYLPDRLSMLGDLLNQSIEEARRRGIR